MPEQAVGEKKSQPHDQCQQNRQIQQDTAGQYPCEQQQNHGFHGKPSLTFRLTQTRETPRLF